MALWWIGVSHHRIREVLRTRWQCIVPNPSVPSLPSFMPSFRLPPTPPIPRWIIKILHQLVCSGIAWCLVSCIVMTGYFYPSIVAPSVKKAGVPLAHIQVWNVWCRRVYTSDNWSDFSMWTTFSKELRLQSTTNSFMRTPTTTKHNFVLLCQSTSCQPKMSGTFLCNV